VVVSLSAHRLWLVVLPFDHLGGDPNDYLDEGITEDLTSDLSQVNGTFVISHASAEAYKGKTISAVRAGRELGVRYVIEGSVRRFDSKLRVNVQLIAADTGASVWSDRFDEDISQLVEGQERIVSRMRASLGIEVVDLENLRRHRDRNTRPDAFGLILQAQAIRNQPTNRQRQAEARALFEQAFQLDPKSVPAMMGVFVSLFDERLELGYWPDWSDHERMVKLIQDARAIAPYDIAVLAREASLYEVEGRYQDAMVTAERAIEAYPNNIGGYLFLARSKIFTGRADEAIPLLAKVIRLDPRDPWLWDRYWRMGYALLLVGRYQESIVWHQRALAVYPDAAPVLRAARYRMMAAAYALNGQLEEARRNMAEAVRIWPFNTVRSEFPMDATSADYAAQIRRYQEGLRTAGLRDHAEEDTDFGVAPDRVLHADPVGYTPTAAPGVETIRTAELVKLLASEKPVVIDTVNRSWGRSIPGAIGLQHSGVGGSLAGELQDHLRAIMTKLTAGDLSRPIVAMGWNSEWFDGRNLSLRLAALGYTNVWWYRGGREAWEVNNLPEAPLAIIDWLAGSVSH